MAHDSFLELELAPESGGRHDDGKYAAPLPDRQGRPGEHQEQAGIDRMPDPSIWTVDDELMVLLDLDEVTPIARNHKPRPDAEHETRERQRGTKGGWPNREWGKTFVEQRYGDLRRGEEISGDEERDEMREPRGHTLGLDRRFNSKGHHPPEDEPADPHEQKDRQKEPTIKHSVVLRRREALGKNSTHTLTTHTRPPWSFYRMLKCGAADRRNLRQPFVAGSWSVEADHHIGRLDDCVSLLAALSRAVGLAVALGVR
jgi:hypothetical protein